MPLMMLVEGRDKALQALPWHRVLPADVVAPAAVTVAARAAFPDSHALREVSSTDDVIARLQAMSSEGRRGFLLVSGGTVVEVTGPPSNDVGADFDLLHSFLEDQVGLDPHEFEFVRSPRHALEESGGLSTGGSSGTACLLPGITERGVEDRAFGRGLLMAHKSTMFLPKVAEGVMFAPVDGIG